MSNLIVTNTICFQTQKYLTILNVTGVLLKDVLIDLRACNFLHVKTSLCASCVHARHCSRNLLNSDYWALKGQYISVLNDLYYCFLEVYLCLF